MALFNGKEWHDRGSGKTPTPINADAQNDQEKRISDAFTKIVDIGSNENGIYIKFESNTSEKILICFMDYEGKVTTEDSDYNGILYTKSIDINKSFPYPFVESPICALTPYGKGWSYYLINYNASKEKITTLSLSIIRKTTDYPIAFSCVAIGKWE